MEPQISPLRFAPVEMTNNTSWSGERNENGTSQCLLLLFFLSFPKGICFPYAKNRICPKDQKQIPFGNDRKKSNCEDRSPEHRNNGGRCGIGLRRLDPQLHFSGNCA